MEKFVINGGAKLSGKLRAESAKNAVLPILAASVLTDEEVVIRNCPAIADVLNMIKILNYLGVKTKFQENNLIVNASGIEGYAIPSLLGKELRSSVFMMGALVSRFKRARLSYPGGCNIGARPVDLHLKGLEKLGVSICVDDGTIECYTDELTGAKIKLSFPSVGATENIMLAAVTAKGKTEIRGAAREPEIVDLMRFLNKMGAKIYGAGTATILIEGVEKLHGTEFTPITDRIETGTYLIAAAITGGELEISGCNSKNICSILHKLCDNTCKISIKNDIIYLKSGAVRKPFNISTAPHPYFPTDLQAQMMSLAAVSEGRSVITETVFESRFGHVSELIKMGADVTIKGKTAVVNGVKRLNGSSVVSSDLRGGAALVLAGLNAEGVTEVYGVNHVKRGYLDMDKKLRSLGADIRIEN